jgi:hypothetical protein
MEQGRRKLTLHPLSQRQGTHLLLEEGPEVQHLDQLVQGFPKLALIDLVDGAVHEEGVHRRDIPRKLVAIAHDQADIAQEVPLAAPGHVPQYAGFSTGGMEQAGEHLQGGRLARSVGTQESHYLPVRHVERNAAHSLHGLVLACEQAAGGRAQAGLPLMDTVGLLQLAQSNHGQLSHGCGKDSGLQAAIPWPPG